jgi:type IV pilus assembly protein PilF
MRLFTVILMASFVVACASSSKADRDRAALHLQIGTGYLSSGQYPMAMQELLKAEQLDPKNPMILNNLGLAYFVRGKNKLAEEKFREAIGLDRRFSDAKNNLGRVLLDTNRASEAIKVLREVEGDLTYQFQEKTFSNLGMAYFNLGNFKKADDYLSRSLEIRRQSCTTADFYGRTLLEMKHLVQAAQVLDQAIEYCRQERFEEPLYFSAMSYFSLGEKEKTRARLEELLKDYPKSKYVAKAKGMLELLDQ